MPPREILGKIIGFSVVAISLIAAGILSILGPHAYNDYFNTVLGLALMGLGLLTGGLGTLIIAGIYLELHRERARAEIHTVPRPGPLGPPPPWGMGNVGRPDAAAAIEMQITGIHDSSHGSVKLMRVTVNNWDFPVFVVGLLIWTAVFLVWLSPH